ncbi:MAG: cbb3-type cytochrome c oxidase subunit 3 [Pseudomonadota bacterium]
METYTFLRYLADSWVLLAMTLFYIGVIVWAFRPGSRATHDHIAQIPLRDDPKPACTKGCAGCPCKQFAQLRSEGAVG